MIAPRLLLIACFVALAPVIGASPALAQSVQDFQLPPSPTETPTEPVVQGPVDDSGIIARPPRAVNTPQPTATTTPSPLPTPAASQPADQAAPAPVSSPAPARVSPTASPTPQADSPATPPTGAPSPAIAEPGFDFSTAPSQQPSAPDGPTSQDEAESAGPWTNYWPWALGVLLLLAGAWWFWRTRKLEQAPPPEIERPVVAERPPETPAQSAPAAVGAGPGGIGIKLEALSLSRSMMNLTLNYRLTITNRTLAMIDKLTVSGDLTSAKSGVPIAQQVASEHAELPAIHEMARLSGKQTKDINGKLSLPVADLNAVRPGAPLYVPLLRLKIDGQQDGPKLQTYVIGMLPTEVGGKLQPFRIDEQPQTYSQIGEQPIG